MPCSIAFRRRQRERVIEMLIVAEFGVGSEKDVEGTCGCRVRVRQGAGHTNGQVSRFLASEKTVLSLWRQMPRADLYRHR